MFQGQEILCSFQKIKFTKSLECVVCSHLEAAICKDIIHLLKMFSNSKQLFGWTHTTHNSKPKGGVTGCTESSSLHINNTLRAPLLALVCFPQTANHCPHPPAANTYVPRCSAVSLFAFLVSHFPPPVTAVTFSCHHFLPPGCGPGPAAEAPGSCYICKSQPHPRHPGADICF